MSVKQSWSREEVIPLFEMPLLSLVYQAQTIHRQYFIENEIELCTLLNIKTGACPENCAYCPQSGHFATGIAKENLLEIKTIIQKATLAKASGATRFCMGAAWRNPPAKEFPKLLEIIKAVNSLGLETCLTAGMLSDEQAVELKNANLNYYNHNLDTSPEYYKNIITSHTYQDRLDTLNALASSGIKICCGGIMGLGEAQDDRIDLLLQLANLPIPPESVPINRLIRIKGTPLERQEDIDPFDFIRVIAVARIMLPQARIRLSAGRNQMSEEMQALCIFAGANSIHFGEKLLVTANPEMDKDLKMIAKLGLVPKQLNQDYADK